MSSNPATTPWLIRRRLRFASFRWLLGLLWAGLGAISCNLAAGDSSLAESANVWWSLRPLVRPSVPLIRGEDGIPLNPVDAFIRARLNQSGLKPSPEAPRQTLIRRLYFDLLGLPPTPRQIGAFVSDRSPWAYERLVDRLLASPLYGERWARHWLDVVHYGETHGYDKDKPRLNAWPYRDYVIRSFNNDKPYCRFVQEQIAGDVLNPDTPDGMEALGFIAAGPWDFIGHEEVPESKIDGKVARHLDRDDMVVNTIQTFNSVTIQCAQCHNHKFDPISQEDYYSLQAVFAALDRADKTYDLEDSTAQQRRKLDGQRAVLDGQIRHTRQEIATRAGQPLKELENRISAESKQGKDNPAQGYHSAIALRPDESKWVQVDLGSRTLLQRIVLHPCHDDFAGIGDGFGFPVRFKVELSDDPTFMEGVIIVADRSREDFPSPKLSAQTFETRGNGGRYIRVTATRLAPRQNDFIFALSELEALTAEGTNVAAGKEVTAMDSIEAPDRWRKSNLTDGWYPGSKEDSGRLASAKAEKDALLAHTITSDEAVALAQWEQDLERTKRELAQLPPLHTAYIASVHTGSGAFAGTGAQGGKPRPIFVLSRGNVQKPGKEVQPGALSCLIGLSNRFELPENHREGDRRAALANWLTRQDNPLTWRSIVNRVWQYHFGRGLVETSNDFGRMGALPSHPELLDWLAVEFRDGGQSLKTLHRLIVASATYRQSSSLGEFGTPSFSINDLQMAEQRDTENSLLWRQNRRKLEAEAIRDAVLFTAGKLDLTMGGPSFQDFVIEHPEHSPHYEYPLHDPEDIKSHRRSIYRFIVRSQPQPFMTILDCADPSMQVGKRNESVSPLQSLSLLNNSLMLTMSKDFAARLDAGGGSLGERVQTGYCEAVGHPPTERDLQALTRYAQEFGLSNYCRLLFNLNEFSFVD